MTTDRDKEWQEFENRAEYEKSLTLAMLARASYEDDNSITIARNADYYELFEGREPIVSFNIPNDYALTEDKVDQFAHYPSGLKAVAFETSEEEKKIIIAFPGMDWSARQITGPARAMAVDGDIVGLLGLLPAGERSETSVRQTGKAQELIYGSHHLDPQIRDALDHAGRLKEKYEARGYTVEVTGYEMGGGLAQIVSHAYGLPGRAFDPMGAQNVIESRAYQEWEQQRGIVHNGIPGLHAPPDFINYVVNNSPISERTGAHIGETVAITGMGGRDPGGYANYAFGKALNIGSHFVKGVGTSAVMEVGGHLADSNKHGKEGIDRIVQVFENAVQTNRLQQWGQESPDAPKAECQMAQEAPSSSSPRCDRPSHPPPNDPRNPNHPDYTLYCQTRDSVHKLDATLGRAPDEASDRLTASLLVEVKRAGLTRVDHVVFSREGKDLEGNAILARQNIFAVQNNLDALDMKRVTLPTAQAVATPEQESFQQLASVNRDLERQREQERPLAQQKEQDDPAKGGPKMG
ncbi:MAG: hypothetical protein LBL59_03505 [Xanthomonadaceae bacterium]|jgi:hypothetical protein|nr:hypothetical protein [Xanthomonadaceae bacterium]